MVASRLDRAQSLWFYSDGYGPVHGYRSQPPLARCFWENSADAHLSRDKRSCQGTKSCTRGVLSRVLLIKMLGEVVTLRSPKKHLTSPCEHGTPIVMGLILARVQVHCLRM